VFIGTLASTINTSMNGLLQHQEVQELIIQILHTCKEQGLTEISTASILLLIGFPENAITEADWNDFVELTPQGVELAIAIQEQKASTIH